MNKTNPRIQALLVINPNALLMDCDAFASMIFDKVLDFGTIVTEEFKVISGIDVNVGNDLFKVNERNALPSGENYKRFGSVKGYLYDLQNELKALL